MRGGYIPARGLQNTNPQWLVAKEKKKIILLSPACATDDLLFFLAIRVFLKDCSPKCPERL
jgi:hypothetical protein